MRASERARGCDLLAGIVTSERAAESNGVVNFLGNMRGIASSPNKACAVTRPGLSRCGCRQALQLMSVRLVRPTKMMV
jgi:hypothetical protein